MTETETTITADARARATTAAADALDVHEHTIEILVDQMLAAGDEEHELFTPDGQPTSMLLDQLDQQLPDPDELERIAERMLRDACPRGATIAVSVQPTRAGLVVDLAASMFGGACPDDGQTVGAPTSHVNLRGDVDGGVAVRCGGCGVYGSGWRSGWVEMKGGELVEDALAGLVERIVDECEDDHDRELARAVDMLRDAVDQIREAGYDPRRLTREQADELGLGNEPDCDGGPFVDVDDRVAAWLPFGDAEVSVGIIVDIDDLDAVVAER